MKDNYTSNIASKTQQSLYAVILKLVHGVYDLTKSVEVLSFRYYKLFLLRSSKFYNVLPSTIAYVTCNGGDARVIFYAGGYWNILPHTTQLCLYMFLDFD